MAASCRCLRSTRGCGAGATSGKIKTHQFVLLIMFLVDPPVHAPPAPYRSQTSRPVIDRLGINTLQRCQTSSYVGLGFGLNIRKILWLLAIMRELAEIRAFSK